MSELMTARELADHLKLKERAIYRMVANREIPYIKLGYKILRFDPSEIAKHLGRVTIKPKQ